MCQVKVLSKDCIFYVAVFYWFILHFSHSFSNWIWNLKLNITYNMIKTQFVLHLALHYNQIYNFIWNYDYKFKTIIVFKDVLISKSKKVYVFLFFECFEHMDPFLLEYIKVHKKLNWFGEHLIRKNDFWNKKPTCPHAFLECFKHIKGLLNHGGFSWKFCSCNFESTTYFKN